MFTALVIIQIVKAKLLSINCTFTLLNTCINFFIPHRNSMKKALGSSFTDEDTKVQGHMHMASLGVKTRPV